MPRIEVNRSGEMEAFVQVVESGGFSSAARLLGMTPSAVSKLVARLELRLGIQLVHRSTRKRGPTYSIMRTTGFAPAWMPCRAAAGRGSSANR